MQTVLFAMTIGGTVMMSMFAAALVGMREAELSASEAHREVAPASIARG